MGPTHGKELRHPDDTSPPTHPWRAEHVFSRRPHPGRVVGAGQVVHRAGYVSRGSRKLVCIADRVLGFDREGLATLNRDQKGSALMILWRKVGFAAGLCVFLGVGCGGMHISKAMYVTLQIAQAVSVAAAKLLQHIQSC